MKQSISFLSMGLSMALPINAQKQSKPNILVFIADDAGMDYGCYGNPVIQTPNIDALAAGGMLCRNAFLTAPQSSPSRSSMLSGQFAHTIGTEDLHVGLNDTTKLLTSYLHDAGYFTGLMLKGHIGDNGMKQFDWTDNGWDDWIKGVWHQKAVGYFNEFMDKKGDKPFFLWVAFIDPHRPYEYEPKFGEDVSPKVHDPAKVIIPPIYVDAPETRKDIARYYDEIHRMDKYIGLMMTELKKRKLDENTIIIYLTDNGMPFPRSKSTLYDMGIHTPLIISWKGVIKPGAVYEHLLSTIDLAPTFLDVAGLQKPSQMYGESIKKIFTNQKVIIHDYVFAERNWHGTDEHMRCVRTERYKMIVNAYNYRPLGIPADLGPTWYDLKAWQRQGKLNTGQLRLFECPRPAVEIYDMINDPHELVNLADRPEFLEEGKRLSNELDKWMKATRDHNPRERRRDDTGDRITGFPYAGMNDKEYWND